MKDCITFTNGEMVYAARYFFNEQFKNVINMSVYECFENFNDSLPFSLGF